MEIVRLVGLVFCAIWLATAFMLFVVELCFAPGMYPVTIGERVGLIVDFAITALLWPVLWVVGIFGR